MTTLDPRLLLNGYAMGIFPMADSREAEDVFWVEPRQRAIIPIEHFHSGTHILSVQASQWAWARMGMVPLAPAGTLSCVRTA